MRRLAAGAVALVLVLGACGGGGGGDDELSASDCRDQAKALIDKGVGATSSDVDALVDQGCDRDAIEAQFEEAPVAGSSTTAAGGVDLAAIGKDGQAVFEDYIEALLSAKFDEAMKLSKGPASNIAGYFNALTFIPSVPEQFKPPARSVTLTFNGEGASKEANEFVLRATAAAVITDAQGEQENTEYSEIRLTKEDDKLVVVDFKRGKEGRVSEDVFRTNGSKGSAGGIEVGMGPGFGMRGESEGGTSFANFVFSYKNTLDTEVTFKVSDAPLDNAASLNTSSKLHTSSASYAKPAPPGGTGFGFVYFNSPVRDSEGILTLRFTYSDDEEDGDVEVKLNVDL